MLRARIIVAAIGMGIAAAALLTGCASEKSYASAGQLRDAYQDAGGRCPNALPVPEELIGEGGHGLLCGGDTITVMVVWDTPEQHNRYLADVLDKPAMHAVVGERWALLADDAEDVAGEFGGEYQSSAS